jgi:hypothetical protein
MRNSYRAWFTLAAVAVLAAAGAAVAHATLVFGTVTTDPSRPQANEPFTVRIDMRDPVGAPIEDAIVFVEATPYGSDAPLVASDRFAEPEAGRYEADITLTSSESWSLKFRDQTFPQEEATATVVLGLGAQATGEPLSFIFPPTETGPQSVRTWLLWLIGLPLVAGGIVTVMVLKSSPPSETESDRER